MASKKFMDALNLLCEEKGIEKDVFLEMLKESIAKAYKKNYMIPEANVRVEQENLDCLKLEQLLMI